MEALYASKKSLKTKYKSSTIPPVVFKQKLCSEIAILKNFANDFKPRLKSPKNRFQLNAGLNIGKFNKILSETNHI